MYILCFSNRKKLLWTLVQPWRHARDHAALCCVSCRCTRAARGS